MSDKVPAIYNYINNVNVNCYGVDARIGLLREILLVGSETLFYPFPEISRRKPRSSVGTSDPVLKVYAD